MQYNNPFEVTLRAHECDSARYSEFPVGAALLAKSGEIFTGWDV